jgi:nucleotide-binding universal stress UspA family protein
MERKILVAVDGSPYSLNQINYLGHLFAGVDELKFDFIRIVSTGTLPPGTEWMDELDKMSMLSPQVRTKLTQSHQYMKDVPEQLSRRGINPENITTSVRLARNGIAADIAHEARQGMYDAVLIGRRGIGKIGEMVMGSVSTSVLEKCFGVPVWVVDGEVNSRKFFVPIDGTLHCLRAVDHLAYILQNNFSAEITLFHSDAMLAHKDVDPIEVFFEQWGEEWSREHLSGSDAIFHGPEQILLESGFPGENITRLEKKIGLDPARDIVRLAVKMEEGTIVMGRRGPEDRKGIMQGVSDRVMMAAEHVAVWLVC